MKDNNKILISILEEILTDSSYNKNEVKSFFDAFLGKRILFSEGSRPQVTVFNISFPRLNREVKEHPKFQGGSVTINNKLFNNVIAKRTGYKD